MDDLIAHIRAAIDEDERIALAANPSPWRFRIPNANHLDQNTIFGDGEPRGVDKLRQVCNVEMAWEREANAAHIVRHDPARVLRQVAAHRKILDLHDYISKTGHCAFFDRERGIHRTQCWHCPGCGGRDWDIDGFNSPCPSVLALADAYGIEP